MSDYASSIKKLNDELLAFINRYEVLDDKEPISNALLKRLKKQVNSLNTTSNQYIFILEKQMKNFDLHFSKIMKDYKEERENVSQHLQTSIEVINNKYVAKINRLNEQINQLKKANEIKINQLSQDINYFIISSNQREDIFVKEYEENIKRYDYQIATAKETYNQSINEYNRILEQKLQELDKESENSLTAFDLSSSQLVERLNNKIKELQVELHNISERLNTVRIAMKERFRQESINLNNEIKVLVDEKNKAIVNARNRYSKSQNNSSIEKENKKQEYQTQSQKVLKDFVYNMTELDSYMNSYKNVHNQIVEDEQRETQYKLLDLNKKQTQEISKLISSTHPIHQDYDKDTKKLIKIKNKLYFKQNNQLKKLEYKKLNRYELMYQKELEKTRNNKALLEIDRNYSLKSINEKEQSDNKYYQELNNVYENDMNLAIKISNLRYNQKANLVKCQSRIRSKGLEKDLDISEANFQKKIESIQCSINKYQFEIEGAQELRNIVHFYEDSKYQKKKNYLTVSSLLEIEKCKLLDSYNRRQYNHNVLNSKVNLSYGRKKLELENEQFETLMNIQIQKSKIALQRDIINAAYKIKEDQIHEAEEKNIQNRNMQYAIDSMSHTVLYERFKSEIKIIHQVLSTFILLIRDVESFCSKFILTFLSSIMIRPEYLDMIYVFITDFTKIITEYYSNVVSNLNEHESEIIYKRIEFEEKFKFRTYYNDLLNSYENDRKRILTKKKSITDTLDNYIKTLDNFKGRIYNFENQNNVIKKKIATSHSIEQKHNLQRDLEANHQKIMDLNKKIEDIHHLKNILDKDNNSLSNELKKLDKDYYERVDEIKKMQYNSAISFYDLRRNLSKFSTSVLPKIETLILRKQNMNIKYFDYKNTVKIYRNNLVQFNSSIFKEFYNITENFYEKSLESIRKDKRLLLIKFKHDIEHINAKSKSLVEENQKEYDKKVSGYLSELKDIDLSYTYKEKYYKLLLTNNDQVYEQEVNQILDDKKVSLSQFYAEYHAMSENLKGIQESYLSDSTLLDNDFEKKKLELTKKIIHEKNTVTSDLEIFIKAKDELINHLPSATKFQSQQLNKETRELNTSLGQEIKDVRITFNLERKKIQKNIFTIQSTLEQSLLDHETKHQKEIGKEKKNHLVQLKHLERNIKLYIQN